MSFLILDRNGAAWVKWMWIQNEPTKEPKKYHILTVGMLYLIYVLEEGKDITVQSNDPTILKAENN